MPGLAAISATVPPPAAAFLAHCMIEVLLMQSKKMRRRIKANYRKGEACSASKFASCRKRTLKGHLLDTRVAKSLQERATLWATLGQDIGVRITLDSVKVK